MCVIVVDVTVVETRADEWEVLMYLEHTHNIKAVRLASKQAMGTSVL